MAVKKKKNKKVTKKKKAFKLKRCKSYGSIYEQVVRISPLVADILKKDLEARDDDHILFIRVCKRRGIRENDSFKKFKYKFIMGRIGLIESIFRSRRLLQRKHPSLRGLLYAERHEAEELMKTQMRLFEMEN